MFNPIALELFPEDCRVIHLPSCNQWIYWIKKNGSSSLRREYIKNDRSLKINQEIRELHEIHIYIREPADRYVSGVHTFLEFLSRDDPDIDRATALWFVKRYKFLNQHYMPQIFWLVNLSRYLKSDAKLNFHHLEDLRPLTSYQDAPPISPVPQGFAENLLDKDMEFWFYVDQILYDLRGRSMSWAELIDHYRISHPAAWQFLSRQNWPTI